MQAYNNPNPFVRLGDGATTCKIEGVGNISFKYNNKKILLHEVLYVPTLK
jgi:hypothetical protein